MAIRKIELYGSPVLREKAKSIERITPEILALLDDMVDSMRHAQGAGLAANQIGVALRALVIDLGSHGDKEDLAYLINPEWVSQEGSAVMEEGCLSIPKIFEKVPRPKRVKIKALDQQGNPFELEGEDFLCKALCHEVDHLDGILFIDRLSPLK
ncbi:MAG: peptide deformylase, partial [Acidobacteria bacterium 37-65-4]